MKISQQQHRKLFVMLPLLGLLMLSSRQKIDLSCAILPSSLQEYETENVAKKEGVVSDADVGTCSSSRATGTMKEFFDDGCGRHGSCLVDRCVCDPAYEGEHCERPSTTWPKECRNLTRDENFPDPCMNLNELGWGRLMASSPERHSSAQGRETTFWEKTPVPLRNKDQTLAFGGWESLPRDLGDVAEFGAGPYTKIRLILEDGKVKRTVRSVTLLDPLVAEYVSNPKIQSSYQTGSLCVDASPGWDGGCIKTYLASFFGEDPLREEAYDTVIMINTVEHCIDGVRVFDNIYKSLKPGGILVLGEEYASENHLNEFKNVCHPIRITEKFFRFYLEEFYGPKAGGEFLMTPRTGREALLENRQENRTDRMKIMGAAESLYGIVRKPSQ